jgi:hypothetical protein
MRAVHAPCAALACVLVLAISTGPAAAGSLELGDAGVLHLPVPKSWPVSEGAAVGCFPTWEFLPTESGGALLQVTAAWGAAAQAPLRMAVLSEAADEARKNGTDVPELFLQRGEHASVAWYATTDPNDTDAPDDWAHLLRAQVDVGSLRLHATLLHHEPDGELRQAVLWMLANSRHEEPGPWSGERRLRLGNRPWVLVLPLDGFDLEPAVDRQGGEGLALAGVHEESGLVVSAFLEQTGEKLDGVGWRDRQRERIAKGPFPATKLRTYELHGLPVLQYDARRLLGRRLDQRNLNAYLARDDVWIDVHLSKVDFEKSDMRLFNDFVSGIRIEDPPPGE